MANSPSSSGSEGGKSGSNQVSGNEEHLAQNTDSTSLSSSTGGTANTTHESTASSSTATNPSSETTNTNTQAQTTSTNADPRAFFTSEEATQQGAFNETDNSSVSSQNFSASFASRSVDSFSSNSSGDLITFGTIGNVNAGLSTNVSSASAFNTQSTFSNQGGALQSTSNSTSLNAAFSTSSNSIANGQIANDSGKSNVSVQVSYGNEGSVISGLMVVGYGTNGNINSGFVTVSYGTQGAVGAGITTTTATQATDITNSVSATTSSTSSFNTVSNFVSPSITVTPTVAHPTTADVGVSIINAPQTAIPGQANVENYSLAVTNNGPATLTSVTLSDSLLSQLTNANISLPSGSSFNTTTGVLSGISLASGQSLSLGISGTYTPSATSTGAISENVSVSPGNGITDTNLNNNSATNSIALNPVADLAVRFSTAPLSAASGQATAENYTLSITNNGPSTVTSITLTDSLMSQLANAHFTLPAGSTFNAVTGVLSGISLASGQSLSFGISGTYTPSATATGNVIDTATVSNLNGVIDPNLANNSASSNLILNPMADLSVSFANAPHSAVPGQATTENYSLSVTNNGPSTVTSITLTDSLMSQLSNAHFTLPAGSTFNPATGVLSGISLASGQSLSFGISGTYTPSASATGTVTDTATVSDPSGVTDPNIANNTATSGVALNPAADLAVSFTHAPSNAIPGQASAENYTLAITNNGPSTVTSITLSDSLMSQLTNAHFTLPAGSSFNAVTGVLSGISLASGQSLSFGISGTYTPSATATGNVIDTATVSDPSGVTDSNLANNSASSSLVLNPTADLSVSFASAPQSAVPGQATSENYSLSVTNNGPSTVTSITLTDSLMSQLSNAHFTLPAGSSFNPATGVLSGISLASGQSLSFGISGTYTPSASATGTVIDTATVSDPSGVTDSNLANNSASSSLVLNPTADLSVSFASAPQSDVPGQANSEHYSLSVTNNGPSTVTSITLTDSLMSQLSNVHFTLPAGSSFNPATGVLSGISLASGQSLSFGISGTYTPSASATGTVTDTATVSDPSGVTDPNAANNTATSGVTLNPAADLAVSFVSAPESAVPGQATAESYTLAITNNGPSTVTSITLSDSLMTQLTNAHFTLPAGSSFNAVTGVLSGISLASGQSLSFGISGTYTPSATATGNVIDTATVSDPSGVTDSNLANNSASSSLVLNPTADLSVSFATAPQSAVPGQATSENYSLSVTNNGPSTVTSITLTDSLMSQLSNAHFTLPAGSSFDPATGVLSGISLASGQSLSFGISGTYTPSASATGTVTDTATVSDPSGVIDPNAANNTATSGVALNPAADLAVNFTTNPTNAIPGQATAENYTLSITNNGPSTVTSITLSDSLMTQLTNAHFTLPTGSSFNAVTGVLSGISLASGQSLSFGISGTYTPSATATGNVIDTATVSDPSGVTDSNLANNSASSSLVLNPTADLSVSFASTPQSAVPGQGTSENYSLSVTNNGPSTVTSITLTDSLMSQLSNAHFTLPAGSSFDAATGVLSGISLASGQSLSFGISGTYTPSASATGTVTDTATVSDPSGVTDPNTANNTATSGVTLNPAADLAVSFVSAPESAVPGQATAESYTLAITNNGPSTVTSITLSDSLMTQLTNAHFTLPAGSSFNAVTGVLGGISLASGQSLSFGISGTYTPSATATGNVIDTATVSDPSGVTDSNLANNSASSSLVLNPTADLSVSFASAPQSAVPGQATSENYSLSVTNNGPSTVTSITLTDSLMSQLSNAYFTLPAGSSFDASTGVLSSISLASGQSLSFGISGTYTPSASATGTVTDTATVSDPSGVTDPSAANNTATSGVTLNPAADLAVSFVSAPESAVPGQTTAESYTLAISNNGPSTVTSITLSDSLMTQLTNAHFTLPAGSSFNAVTGVLSGISLASGQSLSFGISGTYTPSATATGNVIDTATISDPSGVTDSNLANNSASSSLVLNPTADLSVSFATAPQSAVPGQATSENYSLSVTNNGPSTVTSITLTDSLMSQLSNAHFTLPAGSSFDAATGVLSGISLASGQSLSFGISGTYTPSATATGNVIDTATVSDPSGVTDSNLANNSASSSLVLNPTADLSVSFASALQSAVPGQATSENYSLSVTNNGPSTVTSITLTDSLMSQLSNAHFTLPAGSSFDAATGVLSGISLASGQSLSFGISGTYTPSASATGTVTDTATVSDPSGVTDPNTANNTVTSGVALNPAADLAVNFTTNPTNAIPGQASAENYTLAITNNGPSTVTSITLSDSLMSQLTNAHFTLPAGSSFNAVTGVLSGISLASGQSLSFDISGTYTPSATATGNVIDTATVSDPSGVTDSNLANNSASSSLVLNPTADLSVSFASAPQSAVPGQATSENYSLSVTNNGPSTVTSITLTDSLMSQLSNAHFTLPAGSSFDAATGVLSGISLASGQSLSFGISGTYTPSASATGTVTDTATVSDPSGVTDPSAANNTATSGVTLNPAADLAVSFVSAPESAVPGQATAENYTLSITNNGPSTVTSITLSDSLMTQLTNAHFTLPTGSSFNAVTGVLSGISLASGQSLSFDISGTYTPSATATGNVIDTATVSDPSGVTDSNLANNSASSSLVLNPTADLSVSFATAPQSAVPGQATSENYSLSVTNNGPSTVTSITLTDSLMSQLSNAHFTLPAGSSFNPATGVLSGISLASGQSLSFGISGTYTPSASATGTVTDTATVSDPSGVIDPNTANNTATSGVALNPAADLAVNFTTNPANAIPGQTTAENYTLAITNNGPSTVTSITLSDSLMTQLTNAHFTLPAGSSFNAVTGVLSGISLASGQSLSFGISGTYTPSATATGNVIDTATVSDPSGVTDPNLANNSASSSLVLNPTADLSVSFASAPQSAVPGQATAESYTLSISNNGPSTVTSITLSDSLMSQLTNAHFTLPAGSSFNAVTGVLSGISLASGQSLSFGISGTYTPSASATGTVTDTATVSDPSGVTDPSAANNTATSGVTLNPAADLAVSFVSAPESAVPGQATAENYTLSITNNGPSTVTSITLSDSLMTQLTNAHFTLPTGSSFNAVTGVLSGISLASGQSLSFGISGTYTPSATATGNVIDTATVSDPSGVTDSNLANNSASSSLVLNPTADLSVSFASAPQSAVPGQGTSENYTLAVTNNGPSTVTSITLTDSLMSQLSNAHFTLPAGSSFNPATGVLSGISLASGQSLSFGISGTYTPSASATGTVTDTATVSDPSGVIDPNTVNNTATSGVALNPAADLAVNFTTNPTNAIPGQATAENYTLAITNNGPSTVTSITLSDSLMTQLTNAHFTLPAGSSFNAVTGVLSGISLASGQSLSFGISGTYTPSATATGNVIDTATVSDPSGVTDSNLANNSASSSLVLNPTADLSVSFASAPQSAVPGQATSENYSLSVTNNGPSTVTSITLTDSLMSQLSNAHFTLPAGSSFDAATGVLSGISLASGQSLSFGISGTYTPSASATGTVTDTATVSDPSGVIDPNAANNTATSGVALNPVADLAVNFTSAPTNAIPGQATAENYTLSITNNGPSTVTSITLSDSLMTQLTNAHFTLPAGSSFNAVTGVLSGISLASGQSLSFGISGTYTPSATATGNVIDTATVSDPSGVTDSNLANNSASSSLVLNPTADLSVSFASAPQSAVPGQATSENYSLSVTNNGPSTVTSITLTDSLMSQLSNAHFTLPAGSSFNPATGVLSGISLASGQSLSFGISGTYTPSASATGTVTDTATVYDPSGVTDPNAANNTATNSIVLNPTADLAVSFISGPNSATPGQANTESYSVQITNNGPSTVTSITLSDSLISQLANKQYTLPPGSSYSADTHVLSGISLASGQSLTFGVTGIYTPSASATGTVSDIITVADPSGVTDPNITNNTVTGTITLTPKADLAVSFSTTPTSAIPGQATSENYTLQITNNGPSTVTSITLTDSLMTQLTNAHFTLPAGSSFNAVTGLLSGISLASGQSLSFGISGTYTPSATATGNVIDTATVSDPSGVTDSNLANNTASSSLVLNPTADLSVSFATAPQSAVPGQATAENYTLSVTNNGSSTVTSITLTDSLMSQLTNAHYSLPAGSSFNPTTGVLSGISLASGQTLSFGISGTYTPSATATGTITDTATVTDPSGVIDPNIANNTAGSTLALTPQADLAISFSGVQTSAIPGQANIESYTLQITNNGPSTVTSVTLTDSLLAQLTNSHFTLPSGSSFNTATGVLSGISLASGQSLSFGISGTYTPSATATGTVTDTATVADPSGAIDTNTANNTVSSSFTLTPTADLSVSFVSAPQNIIPGLTSTESYALQITNNGPSTVTSITLKDSFMSQLTNAQISLPAGSSYNSSTGVLSGISLATGQSIQMNISGTYTASSTATGNIIDTATVSTATTVTDPNTSNNSASATVTLTPQASLAMSIAASLNSFIPGSTETYTIVLTNNGPSMAYNVSVFDVIPLQGLSNLSSPNLPSGVTFNASTDTWSIGNLAAGSTTTLYLTGTIPAGATGATYLEQATASASDASSVTAQSIITPTGIVTAFSDIDTVPSVIGGVSSTLGNVITGYSSAANPGEILRADSIDAYGGAHIVSISFGNNTQTFSIPSEVHVNSQGSYLTIAGTYGTLNIFSNGNYSYTVTSLPASIPGSSLNDGSINALSSGSAMSAAWTGAGLYAYNFGSPYLDSSGHLNLSLANGQVAYDTNGIGVIGSQNQLTSPTNQIGYDPVANQSEALVVDLKANVTQATVTISNLFNSESSGEQGLWEVYNSAGLKVGQGLLNSATINYGSSDNVGTSNIQVLGANGQPISFEYIVFTALPYPNANPANNVLTDSSDYLVRDIQYTTASTTPNLQDVFTYTVADSNNNSSSTTLTIKGETADLGVAIANNTTNPVAGANDTYTITVTNNGTASITSLSLTDTVMNDLNSLNAFYTVFHNPVFTPSIGTYNVNTGAWSGITLAIGQSITMTVSGTIDSAATGALVNTVSIANTTSGIYDSNLANNSAESSVALTSQPNLTLSMTESLNSVAAGSSETYTFTISNTGLSNAYNVSLVDTLPSQGLTNISSTNLPSGVTFNSATNTWSIGTLAAGATDTITLTGTVSSTAASGSTYINQATASAGDASNVNATVSAVVVQHLNAEVSYSNTSGSAAVVELGYVNQAAPWEAIYTPIVLPSGTGQSYISVPTDFNITSGTHYSVSLELVGNTSGGITINGFLPSFTDVINPSSLSGSTDSRYGTASNWGAEGSSYQLNSTSAEGFTSVVTAGTSSSAQGSLIQGITHAISGNTPTDNSNNVSLVYGSPTSTTHLTVTGGNAGDFLDAASNSTHHYAIVGGTGSDVIIYDKQDASINGGTQNGTVTWNTLELTGNDSISLNTSNNVTTATTANGISGGVQLSNLSIFDLTGYNVDSNGNPIINSNNTVNTGSNSITLHANDVLNMSPNTYSQLVAQDSSFNQIANNTGVNSSDKVAIINGTSNNMVTFAEGNWASAGTVTEHNGSHYAAYTHAGTNGTALVLVNLDITHIVGHS